MTKVHRFAGGIAAAALVILSITPAVAGGRWGRGWGNRHHDRVTVNDVVTGIVVLGTLAAIANSFKKSKRYRTERTDRSDDGPVQSDTSRGRIASENDAVDACAEAVEDRAGQAASVRQISNVVSKSDGWDVDGVVERRSDWRSRSSDTVKFNCSVRFGRVEAVSLGSDNAV